MKDSQAPVMSELPARSRDPDLQRIESEMEAAALERESWQSQVTLMLQQAEVLYRQMNDEREAQLILHRSTPANFGEAEPAEQDLKPLIQHVQTLRRGLAELEGRCLPNCVGLPSHSWAVKTQAHLTALEELLELSLTKETLLSEMALGRLRQTIRKTAQRLDVLLQQQPRFVTYVLREADEKEEIP